MEILGHLHEASGQDGSPPLLPKVRDIAAFARPEDLPGQIKLLKLKAAKVRPIYEKMYSDTHTRIGDAIILLRGCRLLNHFFCEGYGHRSPRERARFCRKNFDG